MPHKKKREILKEKLLESSDYLNMGKKEISLKHCAGMSKEMVFVITQTRDLGSTTSCNMVISV